ncbi:hypothetical protein M407DRAFT_33996 [Tulasnella calospora MUT 4182]|uniref:Uncharacterized protein n=1 Tax=Tulasnella calospora MUT 4182 TaxID=1051891 RepID=A0A0C3Q222_9AGAM|nr:hypothetical protein M407DRAFT_33996 [Tulasnella calospora MUT 4182]
MILPVFSRLQAISSLENLHWSGRAISSAAELPLCDFLSNASHLRSLSLDTHNIPQTALLSASQISTLTTASLCKFQDAENSTPCHALFESLTDLDCEGTHAGLVVALHTIKSPKLRHLCIRITDQRRQGPNPFDIFKESERFPALIDLRLEDIPPSWAHFEAIFSLKGLKTLRIKPRITGSDWPRRRWPIQIIRLLAKSFPQLQVLVLGAGYHITDDHTVSLPDLECFAQFCPNLRQLVVAVDARGMESFSGYLTPHTTLEEVDLGESEADGYEIEIAKVIRQLWPCLQSGINTWEDINAWLVPRWERIWKDVERLRRTHDVTE